MIYHFIFSYTRNEVLLDSIKVDARYKVNELDDEESHHLFTCHAFGDNDISVTFLELSKEILQHAGGLPLALTTRNYGLDKYLKILRYLAPIWQINLSKDGDGSKVF